MITEEQECYLFIADEKVYKVQGSWPSKLATHLCKQYKNVICVSLYSNTIKFLKDDIEIHATDYTDGVEHYARSYKEVHFDKNYYELV